MPPPPCPPHAGITHPQEHATSHTTEPFYSHSFSKLSGICKRFYMVTNGTARVPCCSLRPQVNSQDLEFRYRLETWKSSCVKGSEFQYLVLTTPGTIQCVTDFWRQTLPTSWNQRLQSVALERWLRSYSRWLMTVNHSSFRGPNIPAASF